MEQNHPIYYDGTPVKDQAHAKESQSEKKRLAEEISINESVRRNIHGNPYHGK